MLPISEAVLDILVASKLMKDEDKDDRDTIDNKIDGKQQCLQNEKSYD